MLGEQAQEVQQLRKEVVRLAAEMSRVKKVILRFGKGGWDKQGRTQGAFLGLLVRFSCSLHPPIPYWGLLVEHVRYKSPFLWPSLTGPRLAVENCRNHPPGALGPLVVLA